LPDNSRDKETAMAKGRRCPDGGEPMYAQDERYDKKGTWVTYVCRAGNCAGSKRGYPATEKVFEDN
jgi:hypothetical protein